MKSHLQVDPSRRSSLRVLLIEHHAAEVEFIRTLVAQMRHRLTLACAECMASAMGMLRCSNIDVIITDLDLPDCSPSQTLRMLQERGPRTPIVVLSDVDDEDAALTFVEQGAQDYLVKGHIDGPLLLRSLRYAIERHRYQTELRNAHALLEQRIARQSAELTDKTAALSETEERLGDALTRLEEAQQRMVQRERLHALGRMASGIAHDFNNALAPIVGFSELLLRPSPAVQRKAHEYLKLIQTAANDGAEIVRRLREFYRHRDEHDVFSAVRLNDVVRQAVALTQPRWKDQALGRGAHVRIALELATVPAISGSESELRELLLNLIFNAVDAIPTNGTITCRTFSENGSVMLQVEDTGTGMSEEVRQKCLEPFFTTKAEAGTGLGLAMVFGIVRRHDGDLRIESSLGAGTKITVSLMPHKDTQSHDSTGTEIPARRGLRILVVDDEAAVREVLSAYLGEDGHQVETASDGVEALERFQQGEWDLVMTDRAMPRMNGDRLGAEVKRISPETPVILVTGFADVMQEVGDHPKAIDLVVRKPFTLASLRAGISQVLPLAEQSATSAQRTEEHGIRSSAVQG